MTYNITHQQRNQGQINSLISVGGFLLIIALLWNVIGLFSQYLTRQRLLTQDLQQKTQLAKDQESLKYRTKRAQTETYVEERARQIGLTKDHEYVVVAQYPIPSLAPVPVKQNVQPPYQAWIQVFTRP